MTSYIIVSPNVVERINYGVAYSDPDALQANVWADEYLAEKGNYSGIDGHLTKMFRMSGKPDAVKKFVNIN